MTSSKLNEIWTSPEVLLALEPEELGGIIIEHVNAHPENLERTSTPFPMFLGVNLADFDPEQREAISNALVEAWHWLEREGLVLKRPFSKGFFLTRRGRRLQTRSEVEFYIASQMLPRRLLHPRVVQRAWGAVLRGDLQTAVFLSFREVEIAVRAAADLPAELVGVPLVRDAFNKLGGPLSDSREPEGEREALSHLFAGAIGRFKNPPSHRDVLLSLAEASEALTLASMLLRIVDSRLEEGVRSSSGETP